MVQVTRHRLVALLAIMVMLVSALGLTETTEAASTSGAVYTLSNQVAGNEVVIFTRGWDGKLTSAGSISTGGTGTGAGLSSQGGLTLSANKRWLLAVNAGSNDVSTFAVSNTGVLTFADKEASGGTRPISVTNFRNLVYVLNVSTTGAGNISGFWLGTNGSLTPIPGSTQPLTSATANAAQVQFSPNGRFLVVTEKATSLINTYPVGANGVAGAPTSYPSSGSTPFGFSFTRQSRLIVSEAAQKAVSSYNTSATGAVSVISASVSTDQAAPCWIAVTESGRFAYTTNAGSASITGYAVHADGSLARLNPSSQTANTGATPIDMAINRYGNTLYVLQNGAHAIGAYSIGGDGSLTSLGDAGTLLPNAGGLAAL